MKFLLSSFHLLVRQRLAVASVTLLVTATVGCASPGPPRAPSLNLPDIARDVTADRIGDEVVLRWDTPTKNTDRLDIKGPITAEICRAPVVAVSLASPSNPAAPPACTVVKRLPVQSGPTQAVDVLPHTLTAGPAVLLAYRVQLLNVNGRSAGPSKVAFAVAGSAPPLVEQLKATPVRQGVMLEWQKTDSTAEVVLDRRLVGPDGVPLGPVPVKVSPPKTTSKSRKLPPPSAATPKPQPHSMAPATPAEIRLKTPSQSADSGGTLDETTRIGEGYSYTAQRVRSVTLDGHTLQLRSAVSSPVVFVSHDIFPPLVPTGLEAVPGGATAADRSIDLSWTPNTEADLAGYSVYRQEVTSSGEVAGTAARLNSTPIVGPAYRDQTVVPGRRYSYRVTAMDASGNESAPSAAVQETLREQ